MYYCVTFNFYKSQGKTKIDYGFIPVSFENGFFHSTVSKEVFKNLKKKNNYFILNTKKYFQIIIEGNDKFETAEREILPVVEKIIRKKLFFNFNLKNKLRERIKRILG